MKHVESSNGGHEKRLSDGELGPWPHFDEDVISEVSGVLRSGKVNQWTGFHVNKFAKEFASYVETDETIYAVPNANGSTALQLALFACGIKEGDDVIVSPRSFIISSSCPLLCGATPVFADVDTNGNLYTGSIAECISAKTKAVIVVHMGGLSCEMEGIVNLCKEKNIYLIEDCSQSHGAKYMGKHLGTLGDIGTWSFCQDKIITTGGEGGICVTKSKQLFNKMWSFKDHGRDYELCTNKEIKWKPGYRRLCTTEGTNFRMTEMQAVIGRNFLRRLDSWVALRNRNANILLDGLQSFSMLRFPKFDKNITYHAYYRVYVYVSKKFCASKNITNVDICERLKAKGVPASVGSCATLWEEPCFKDSSGIARYRNPSGCPKAYELFDEQIAFLCHPTITAPAMSKMTSVIAETFATL